MIDFVVVLSVSLVGTQSTNTVFWVTAQIFLEFSDLPRQLRVYPVHALFRGEPMIGAEFVHRI